MEISVIVPVYKVEQYLPKCIESILVQTFTDFELLLIDDGSPDRCGEICEEYARKDERVKVFHQKNAGVSVARNVGLEAALGKYIAFVDSDDWVMPDYLLHLYGVLPCEGVGLIMGGALKYSTDSNLIGKIELPGRLINNIGESFVECRLDHFGFPWSKLYNAKVIRSNKLRFSRNIHCMEDLFFMMDYILYSDYILLCNFTDYNYRSGYSHTNLSSRMNSYENEYDLFSAYRCKIKKFEAVYSLSDKSVEYLRHALSLVFQRVLLSIHVNSYSLKQRLSYLRKLLRDEKKWMKNNYMPDYKADCIAKYFLCKMGGRSFDCWISFLRFCGFKYSFGMKYLQNK